MRIDLNADLGEGFGRWALGDDDALLPLITSANVACGFHAGDPSIMLRVCRRAAELGVTIGAQVSYRDLAGFGRRRIDLPPAELTAEILYQIGALQAFAGAAGTSVRYLKPHGALYNAAAADETVAGAVVEALTLADSGLSVLTLPGSALATLSEQAGIRVVAEGFADRNYLADGSLVPRTRPDAVLNDPSLIAARAVAMVVDGAVSALDGTSIPARIESLCVHGDTPGAVDIARAVRDALIAADVTPSPAIWSW